MLPRVTASLMFAIAATAGLATDTVAPEQLRPGEESIATARKDFDALKKSRDLPLERGQLPQVNAPELSLPNAAATVLPRESKPPADLKTAKGKNWLVDAMMKPERTSGGERPAREASRAGKINSDSSRERDTGQKGGRDIEDQLGEPTSNRRESDVAPPAASNPLNHYMAGWMTSADFNLLRPGLETELKPGDSGRAADLLGFAGPNLESSGVAGRPAELPTKSDLSVTGSAPTENPYLKSLDTFTRAEPPVPAATPVSPATWTPAPPPPSPEAAPPAKPVVPEFAKPNDDAKYFKQLKRF